MDLPLAVETGEMPEPVQFERGHAADIEGCRSPPLRRHHRHVPAQPGRRAIRGRTSIDTVRNPFEPTDPSIVMDRRPGDALLMQPRVIHHQPRGQPVDKPYPRLALLS